MKSGNEEPLILYFVQLNFPRGHSSSSSPFSEDYSSHKHSLVLEYYIWTQYCLLFKDFKICFSKIYSLFHQRLFQTKPVDLYERMKVFWKKFSKEICTCHIDLHLMLSTTVVYYYLNLTNQLDLNTTSCIEWMAN